MAEDALNFLLQNMQNMVVDHGALVSGAENELNFLKSEVRTMTAFLQELGAQAQPRSGRSSREYERQVRDVAHQAEDILDECLTRAALEKSTKFVSRFLNTNYISLANQVKSFRRDIIKPLFDKYGIDKITSSTLQSSEIPHSTTTRPNDYNVQGSAKRGTVVGFEKDADTIIKLLTEEEYNELEVISIIGMPGLGKTTLARKIYHDKRLKTQFPKVIWVDVSQNFQKRKVFLSILERLAKVDTPSLSDDDLAATIKLYLQNQKFLLFLDDLWNEKDWEHIEAALPKDNSKGRILITSRINSVAVKANCRREPYKLGFLDESKSWDLLQLQVFDNLNICPRELDELGRKIACACGGVPLAIVVIAGVLLKIYSTSTGVNEKRIQWDKVSKSVRKYLHDEKGRTTNLIALSYNELPLDLRYCFLYLGIFPEECQIPVRRLIRMWIAEGFIWRKPDMSLEEVGYDHLKDLRDRNLVMVDNINIKPDGYIKTCHVHDLIREFCKNEASLENHNLFQEMEMSTSEGTFYPPVSEIQNRRRICIHSHVVDFLNKQPKGPQVHSFLCFAKDAVTVTSLPAGTSPIPLNFNRLRVLDVNPIKLTKFPSKLTQLIHLRYIALSGDGHDFRVLPKAISSLWNLQSITIETNSRTFEIKGNLWKMVQLRHLKTKAAIILQNKPKGTAGEQLQSLSRLSAQCCTQGVFNRAKNLKNLGIRGDLACILEVDYFKELRLLQKLKLVYDVYPKVASEKPLSRLPVHERFPPNLRILELSGTFLPWSQIRTLKTLPSLEVLKLKKNAFVGKYWQALNGCFASLEILAIAGTNLEVWSARDGDFPKLRCLVLKDCNQLVKIPFDQLKENLEMLHVENVSESAVESAKKIAEEKLQTQGQQSAGGGGFRLMTGSEGKR
ncbi:hypothetical protein C2S52_020821 [Perilla frutescens var. hirtella]|nr:hypothetical protein C2S52_020821 [Perilla frutescens var. hirtella]